MKTRGLELNRAAARFFHAQLFTKAGETGLQYLRKRQISEKTLRRFGLGFAPAEWSALRDHLRQEGFSEEEMLAASVIRHGRQGSGTFDLFRGRVMFPIIDLRGAVIAFGGRTLGDGQPKYLNSPDTLVFKKSRGLFAMNFAKATKQTQLILCEGYMDAIAIHQAGFDNAVATLGTALTQEQARLMAQYTNEAVLAYDSDAAGQRATRRAAQILESAGLRVRVLEMAGAKDPDEYIKAQGAARFRMLLEGSANATEYAIAQCKSKYNLETDDGKVEYFKEFCALLAKIPDRVEADVYINRAAAEFGVSRQAVAEQVQALRARNAREQKKKFDRDLKIYPRTVPNQTRDAERERHFGAALAEDRLIAALLWNPEFFERVSARIAPEDFVTEGNRKLCEVLWRRLREGKSLEMMSLSAELSQEQMARLAYLQAANAQQAFTLSEAEDFIRAIKTESKKLTEEQIGDLSPQELQEYLFGAVASNKK
jgi:DNA primase